MRDLLQHFPREEKEFAEKIIDSCQQVENTYSHRVTSFLNPRQVAIATSIAHHFQLLTFSSLELVETEFSRMIIAPSYYQLEVDDFDMMALEIAYPQKFHKLTHAQILGTLLNQLGIKRQFIGDILLSDNQAVVLIDRKFGQLLQTSVQKIARVPVNWIEVDWTRLELKVDDMQTRELLLSSLRLDKIVSTAFKLSRASAVKLIEGKQVKLDYAEETQAGSLVELGQLISVRGFGRIRLREVVGYTKQGKLKVDIELIKK